VVTTVSVRAPRPSAALRVLTLTTLQQAGLTTIRFGLPVLAPFWRDALGLSLGQVGILFGIFDFGALLLFLPLGLLADRVGEPTVLTAGALFTGAMAAAVAGARSFGVLAFLLGLAGLGYGSGQTAGAKAVATAFGAGGRGTAMGIRQSGLPLGGMIAALLIPALAGAFGWRIGVLGAAAVCAAGGVLCAIGLRDAANGAGFAAAGRGATGSVSGLALATHVRGILDDAGIRRTSIVASLLVIGQFCYQGYLALYMVDRFGWSKHLAAALLLAVHGGGIVGRLGWGALSDRVLGGKRTPAFTACAALSAIFPLALIALPRSVPVPAVAAVACAGGMLLLGWNGIYSTLIMEHAGTHEAGVAMGLSMTMLYTATFIALPLFGWFVERTSYAAGWAAVVVVLAAALVLSRRIPEPAKITGRR
jgi:sugar phosphate permease